MIATLSTCAQLERDNISFRLQSGRKRYIEKGGKLGRKVGSVKTAEQMKAEYREVISLLRKGYSIRDVAKLCGKVAKTEHSHPLGMVVSTHFRCGKGVKRGLKNGALPFNID